MSQQHEEWRPIKGYPDYQVSNRGRVMSTRPHPWKPSPRELMGTTPRGYRMVYLFNEGGRISRQVHVLVLEAFVAVKQPGQVTRHLDGNPLNNQVENLTFGTQSENMQDRLRHGRDPNANKVACLRGHAFVESNTYCGPDGSRSCRTCRRDTQRACRQRKMLRAANVRQARAA